jgi:Tol biopolymer transport system component
MEHSMRVPRVVLSTSLLFVLTATTASAAHATYPGDNGDLAFGAVADGETQPDIFSVPAAGSGAPRRLTHDPGFDACAAYDATGQRIAFCSGRTGGGELEIWTMNADGTDETQLTHLNGFATFPDFSPTGHRVAFGFRAEPTAGSFDIWEVRRTGRHPRPLTDDPNTDDAFAAYSPDGRWIVFVRAPLGQQLGQLWIMDRNGRRERQLTFDQPLKWQVPDWRPDGEQIAYQAGLDVWVIDPDGGGQRNITNTPQVQEYGPVWSPDGRRMAYMNPVDRRVYTMRANGGDVVDVAPDLPLQFVPAWQPLPDDLP